MDATLFTAVVPFRCSSVLILGPYQTDGSSDDVGVNQGAVWKVFVVGKKTGCRSLGGKKQHR